MTNVCKPTGLVPVLDSFGEIAERYDVILCDVWGVLHDGRKAHAATSDALVRFRGLNGSRPRRVILVSNAPRPWRGVQAILDGFGIPRDAYDLILTSGDLTHEQLADMPEVRVYHLGPERDRPIFEGLALTLVDAGDAQCVVCTGLFDDNTETAEDYRKVLVELRERGIPMICANPDLVVERDGALIPCAGLIAALFEEIGGEVSYAGKPHGAIYEAAYERMRALDPGSEILNDRILAIGDALKTDIAGANAARIPSLFVARGIHAKELGLHDDNGGIDLSQWLSEQNFKPEIAMKSFRW